MSKDEKLVVLICAVFAIIIVIVNAIQYL